MIVEVIIGAVTLVTLGALALTNAVEKRSPRYQERAILLAYRKTIQVQIDKTTSYDHAQQRELLDRLEKANKALVEFDRKASSTEEDIKRLTEERNMWSIVSVSGETPDIRDQARARVRELDVRRMKRLDGK